ncbi:MAG: hypothetical protein A4E58_00213 [Syntrophorhabdus sp. PtaB.Bin006]|nr:MAG: hypothetical protein A4E58_00213 [Syntrophorhabdus sp. PtaB.Bin006]
MQNQLKPEISLSLPQPLNKRLSPRLHFLESTSLRLLSPLSPYSLIKWQHFKSVPFASSSPACAIKTSLFDSILSWFRDNDLSLY